MTDMDYVQEELARQRRILAVLMMGGQVDAGGQDEGSERLTRQAELSAMERTESSRSLPEEPDAYRQIARMAKEQDVIGENIRRTRTKRDEERRSTVMTEPTEMIAEEERDLHGNVVRERTVTEILWVDDGGTSGVGDLSRMFERDARRYDGGFSLY